MSTRDTSAAVAVAYDPAAVPVSDRILNLVEAPQGAMALFGVFCANVKVAPSAFWYDLNRTATMSVYIYI